MATDILVVDDEADIRDQVAGILSDEGYAVRTAQDSESAVASIGARKPALLVLDIWMNGGGMDGLELLDLVKSLDGDLPVIMISGHGNIETAVSAIKRGAYDFLEKPFKSDRLLLVVERALEQAQLKRENRRLRTQAFSPDTFIGKSPPAQQLRQLIAKLGPANSRLLVSGPPGAGKELVARLIHAAGPRAKGEFIVEFKVPKPKPHQCDAYLRFIPRTEMDIAVVGCGVNVTLDAGGTCIDARVVIGAVAPTAVICEHAAKALIGHKLDEATLAALDAAVQAACKPITDKRGTIEYRTKVAGVIARRTAAIAFERAAAR